MAGLAAKGLQLGIALGLLSSVVGGAAEAATCFEPKVLTRVPGAAAAPSCPASAYTLQADIRYAPGNDAAHLLDLYLPSSGQAPFPTVVWVHGGGWRSGSKSDVLQAQRLLCSGFALASLNYRLSGEAIFPAQIIDVKAALRFLRAGAGGFGLDGNRFGIMGSSAGGHLASLAGTSGDVTAWDDASLGNPGVSSRVQAVVDWYGPVDLPAMDGQLAAQACGGGHNSPTSPESQLLGCTLGSAGCASAALQANPTHYVDAGDPPFLIAHGTSDCTVPAAQSRALYDSLSGAGACAALRTLTGADHGGPAWATSEAQADAAAFFASTLAAAPAPPPSNVATPPVVNCSGLSVTGDPRGSAGATWVYDSTDAGTHYRLEGILFAPSGAGPFPAVLVSHGKQSMPSQYATAIAKKMVAWGVVAIGPMYTHATLDTPANEPDGPDGASDANVARAHKTRDILSCLSYVDFSRIGAHGHSMGAFLTGQLLGAYPNDFLVASHTAGGTSTGPNATRPDAAAAIRTPYQLHHGTADTTVSITQDRTLDQVLTSSNVPHHLYQYDGYTHDQMSLDVTMLDRVKAWYTSYGLISASNVAAPAATPIGHTATLIMLGSLLVVALGIARRQRARAV